MLKDILEFQIVDLNQFSLSISDIFAVLIFIIFAKILVVALGFALKRIIPSNDPSDAGTRRTIYNIAKYFVFTIAIVLSLNSIGFDITLFLASSAALFVGLGFGLQDAFKDMISGILMLAEQNVKPGDVIQVDDHTVGQVIEIKLRTSKVRTRDGIMIIIPNSRFINDSVINWSNSNKLTRFRVSVGVAYGSDVDLVTRLLLEAAKEQEQITTDPPPIVRFADFGDSSLDFEILFWTDSIWLIESTRSAIRYAIDRKFREHKVSIPFPQRDLHIISDQTGKRT